MVAGEHDVEWVISAFGGSIWITIIRTMKARRRMQAGSEAKVAIVALLAGVDAAGARSRLARAGGNIRLALLS